MITQNVPDGEHGAFLLLKPMGKFSIQKSTDYCKNCIQQINILHEQNADFSFQLASTYGKYR
jgi:hypothetical protein